MIRLANYDEISKIMMFIDQYWRKDHILARDRNFFEYQYVMNGQVNVVISIDVAENINGMLGFVPYGELGKSDIFYAVWKVIQSDDPFLGMKLMRFLMEHSQGKLNACIGINEQTWSMYRFMGFKVGELTQWYRLSKTHTEWNIAIVNEKFYPDYSCKQCSWKEYTDFSDFKNDYELSGVNRENARPYKPAEFIQYRYFNHPQFKYRIFGLMDASGKVKTFIITRLQYYSNSYALRIIDCIGKIELISGATTLIDTVMEESNAEYADFFEVGISDEIFIRGGWVKVDSETNVFPDYFAPYVQKNIKIYYSSTDPNVKIFKGDGDQDRPS